MDPSDYGKYYWCIRLHETHGTPRKEVEVYANADRVDIIDGNLVLFRTKDEKEHINLSFAAGQWKYIYAASVLDGHAVSANHWPGQILE